MVFVFMYKLKVCVIDDTNSTTFVVLDHYATNEEILI